MKKAEFIALCLYAVCICIDWTWGVKALILLSLFLVVKLIWQRRVGNPALERGPRWALGSMLAFFGVYALSLLYTANMEEGWLVLWKHLPFLLLPLYFLLSDTSHLSRNHIRVILYCFLAALTVRFLVRLCVHNFRAFDPMHHAYLAMYTLLGFVVVYNELFHHGRELPRWWRAALVVAGVIMLVYTYLIQSRAGLLCMLALLAFLVVHLMLRSRHARTGIALLVVALAGFVALLFTSGNRLGTSLSEVASGDDSDVRFEIWRNAVGLIGENLPFGVGIGDRMDVLEASYPDANDSLIVTKLRREHVFNPHNQYLDTALATGIPGELVLLAILLIPCGLWLFGRRQPQARYMLPLLLIVILSLPFESIFERQMGLLYFAFFYCLFNLKPAESAWTPFAPKNI